MRTAPKLDLGRRRRAGAARVLAVARVSPDPLTGHRGEAGDAVVAELGPATLVVRLTHGASGPVLRGQLSMAEASRLAGALVHARGTDGVALAAADSVGEFAVRGWRGRLASLDVELDEGTWSFPWPGGDA